MFTFRTILFAADFSESSQAAFRVACSMADPSRTRLFVLHVAEPPVEIGPMGLAVTVPGDDGLDVDGLRADLAAAHTPRKPVDVEYLVRAGMPADEILAAAAERQADLIVVGTHGRTGLGRLLTGSVAEQVMRQADCPVLALRAADVAAFGNLADATILHPTDLSENSAPALRAARAMARDHGARLVLLHVAPPPLALEGYVEGMDWLANSREDLAAVRDGLAGDDLKYPIEIRVEQGDPAHEIGLVADAVDARLIVMGSHGRTGFGRLLMGSIAKSTLRRARCPVLMVKSPLPADAPELASAGHPSARA